MAVFTSPYDSPAYFEQALFLYIKYLHCLEDDYALNGLTVYEYFVRLIERTYPLFFVITEGQCVSGFVYLDNIIGNSEKMHSAELVTCFDKRFWGNYTKKCAEFFINYCFKTYGFQKIKALVYPDNFRVKTLLKKSGFVMEALLKNETLRKGELQDIEVYSIFKN